MSVIARSPGNLRRRQGILPKASSVILALHGTAMMAVFLSVLLFWPVDEAKGLEVLYPLGFALGAWLLSVPLAWMLARRADEPRFDYPGDR